MRDFKLFIDGDYCDAANGETFESVNPANGQVIAKIAQADKEDVARACRCAQAAFDGVWSQKVSPVERGRILRRAAEVLRRRLKEFAELETQDVGKPLKESSNIDVPVTANYLEWYGTVTHSLEAETIPIPNPDQVDFTLREPYGVVGCIAPWNFPLFLAMLKIGPALAAGNTVVIKPASWTSLTTLLLGEVFAEAGLPPGVLNILAGPGRTVGEAICTDPHVQKIFFTGSTDVGRRIIQISTGHIADLSMELGGKSPNIIFADADREQAVAGATFGILLNNGQNCIAGSRLLVERPIYDEVVAAVADTFRSLRLGDPMQLDTQLGAIVSRQQHDTVMSYIRAGIEEGAKLVCGGKAPRGAKFKKGYFIEPTLFSGVTNDMRIAREEIFGPVLVAIPFDGEEEAIAIANDTPYGLGSGLFTRDLGKANRVLRRLHAGTVYVNTYNQVYPEAPFPGWKQSGIGVERGMHGFLENTRYKNVIMDISGKPISWF
jgi:acyl-CoA reductase-like NAD-dependent aldehyde dehydrogenase